MTSGHTMTFQLPDFDISCPTWSKLFIQAGGLTGLFCYFLKKKNKKLQK
jgi:hypothetical protein